MEFFGEIIWEYLWKTFDKNGVNISDEWLKDERKMRHKITCRSIDFTLKIFIDRLIWYHLTNKSLKMGVSYIP